MRRPLAILGLSLLAVASLAATAAAAGRRRLGKTMAQARSMGEVVQASAIPLFGGMMAALGTIGNSASSSGGGGFGGGGAGGGGGGAGGGF